MNVIQHTHTSGGGTMRIVVISTAMLALFLFTGVAQGAAQVAECVQCNHELLNPCQGTFDGWEDCAQPRPGVCELEDPSCETGFAALEIAPSGGLWMPGETRSFASLEGSIDLVQYHPGEIRGCGGVLLARRVTEREERAFRSGTATIIV